MLTGKKLDTTSPTFIRSYDLHCHVSLGVPSDKREIISWVWTNKKNRYCFIHIETLLTIVMLQTGIIFVMSNAHNNILRIVNYQF